MAPGDGEREGAQPEHRPDVRFRNRHKLNVVDVKVAQQPLPVENRTRVEAQFAGTAGKSRNVGSESLLKRILRCDQQ